MSSFGASLKVQITQGMVRINKLLNYLIVLILSLMSLLVFINVVLRYGFNSSIHLTEEVARFLFVWLTFLGAVVSFNDNTHVAVNLFRQKFSPRFQSILTFMVNSLMLFVCLLLTMGAYQQFILNLHNYSPISKIPTAITYLAALITGFLLSLILCLRLFSQITTYLTRKKR